MAVHDAKTLQLLTQEYFPNGANIPKFQRPYSWTEDQWRELWNDLKRVASRPVATNNKHYCGPIVLLKQEHDSAPNDLVDGQQRFATLSVALCVIRDMTDALIQEGEGDRTYFQQVTSLIAEVLSTWAENPSADADLSTQRLTFPSNPKDNAAYQAIYNSAESNNIEPAQNANRLHKCRWFFQEELEEFIKSDDNSQSKAQLLRSACIAICKGLLFTAIVVDDFEDAYLVFESMNSQGLDLSATDLLKNRLLHKAGPSNTDYLVTTWKEFIASLDQCRFTAVECAWYFWSGVRVDPGNGPSRKRLYHDIRENIDAEDKAIELASELKEAGKQLAEWTSRGLPFRNHGDQLHCPFAQLETLKYKSVYQNLYRLRHKSDENPDLLNWFAAVSARFLVRNVSICKRKGVVENLDRKIAKAIDEWGATEPQLLKNKILECFIHDDERDEQVEYHLTVGKFEDNNLLKFLHASVWQNESGEGETQLRIDWKSLHLEHILPQEPNSEPDEWGTFSFRYPRGSESVMAFADCSNQAGALSELGNHIYQLGNTCILTQKNNQMLGNKGIHTKLPCLKLYDSENEHGTRLNTTAEVGSLIEESRPDKSIEWKPEWTSDMIAKRSKDLAKRVIEAFPKIAHPS
jgi:hypothetical protein